MRRNLKAVLLLALIAMGLSTVVSAAQADPVYKTLNFRFNDEAPDPDPDVIDGQAGSLDFFNQEDGGNGDFLFLDHCDSWLYQSCDNYSSVVPIVTADDLYGNYPDGSYAMYTVDLPPPPHAYPTDLAVKARAVYGDSGGSYTGGPVAFVGISDGEDMIDYDSTDGTGELEVSATEEDEPQQIVIGLKADENETLSAPAWIGVDSISAKYEVSAPTGTIDMPEGWINENYSGIPIEAHDDGFGISHVLLIGSKRNPSNPFDWYSVGDPICNGITVLGCPSDLPAGYKLEIDPLAMKEGYSYPGVAVYNGFEEGLVESSSMLKIDTQKPTLNLSGSFMTAPGMVLDGDEYMLRIDAEDGNATVHNSGVKRIEVLVDGFETNTGSRSCPNDDCPMRLDIPFDPDDWSNGSHELKVRAKDNADHVETQTVEFEIDR